MYADFQQYYGIDMWTLNIWHDNNTRDVERAAILAAQLPSDSRTRVAFDPFSRVSVSDALLRRIEHNQRLWAYSHSKEAKSGANEPKPLLFDGEQERVEREAARAARHSRYVAERFGLHGLEAVG